MATTPRTKVGNRTVKCPMCGGTKFERKKYLLGGKWLQSLNLEAYGREALMLICEECSLVLHFARPEAVTTVE